MPELVFGVQDPVRFDAAIRRFDEENSHDPNQDMVEGRPVPRELLYAERLTEWVRRLEPNASEALRLAARSQHLCRWLIPRNTYPMNRAGYLKWRADLKKLHAEKAGGILRELGYPESVVTRVQELNLKKNFPSDPEVRVLEDALCLVFLEFQLTEVAQRMEEEKTLNAIRKSWVKMTDRARQEALSLKVPKEARKLMQKALENPGNSLENTAD